MLSLYFCTARSLCLHLFTFLIIHLFDDFVMSTFLAWEACTHESRRTVIGSYLMRTRPGPRKICDVIIEKVYCYIKIQGGKLLAYYEESSRKFLFPDKSLTKKDGLDREILLSRTAKFQVRFLSNPVDLNVFEKTCCK